MRVLKAFRLEIKVSESGAVPMGYSPICRIVTPGSVQTVHRVRSLG